MSSSLPDMKSYTDSEINESIEFPTYSQFLMGSYNYFYDSIFTSTNHSIASAFIRDFKLCYNRITIQDILIVILLTIIWTFSRFLVTKHVFQPIASYFQLPKSDSAKMPESAWKFLFYLSTWTSMAYIILIQNRYSYFHNPSLVWKNYSIDNEIETDIYIIYMIQLSFYVHSLYTTSRIDQWRKDSPALMLHHILCVILISIALTTKSHKSGLLAMFLHDGCDVLLEGTKLSRYFKVQGGKVVNHMETVTNIGFGAFIISWFICRLYWYPLKQVYFASIYVNQNQINVPFIVPIVIMLWLLLLMNVYWFSFILRLLYKVFTGQVKELEDNREYSGDENEDKSESKDDLDEVENKGTNARYYLRQRKMDYSLLHTGRSQ